MAPLLGTNCYLVSDPAGRCVIVDPGGGVHGAVRDAVAEADLVPTIVLITHDPIVAAEADRQVHVRDGLIDHAVAA